VLTSEADASPFDARLEAAIESGCRGVVCSFAEVTRVRSARRDLLTLVPGIRFDDSDAHDQARVGTPRAAARAGADVLVLGRAVTEAADVRAAAQRAHDEVHSTAADNPGGV
jgi:orotidine-5'-phosphate decarboxylase